MPDDVLADVLAVVLVTVGSGVIAALPSVARVSDTSKGWNISCANSMVSDVASTEPLNTARGYEDAQREKKKKPDSNIIKDMQQGNPDGRLGLSDGTTMAFVGSVLSRCQTGPSSVCFLKEEHSLSCPTTAGQS